MRIIFRRELILSALAALQIAVTSSSAQENSAPIRDITKEQVDERQLRVAVASRTLTWLTGSSANNDYVSVGRVANFFGFVGLRVASGQSLSRSEVALDTLAVLTRSQRSALIALTTDQADALANTHGARIDINRALEGLLIGEAISREDFLALGRNYGAREAELGRIIAQRLGEVAQTLTPDQETALAKIRAAYISGQGSLIELETPDIKLPREQKTDLINSAARFLSWTTGSSEYNDFEVVGKPSQHFGFVSLRLESNRGVTRGGISREVREILTAEQRRFLDVAAEQNAERFSDFLDARSKLMRVLETALSSEVIDAEEVGSLGAVVGEIEADMTWAQAAAMLDVRDSLSEAQTSALLALRAKYTATGEGSWSEDMTIRGRQLYAQCSLCHNAGSNFALAPDLSGIVGKEIASDPSYENYSPALLAYGQAEGIWSKGRLDDFLKSPQTTVPGTFMGYGGLEDRVDRKAVISYLEGLE